MFTVSIEAPENVSLFPRYVMAAQQIAMHPGCRVKSIAIEQNAERGFNHQVAIVVEGASYEGEVCTAVRAALDQSVGEACFSISEVGAGGRRRGSGRVARAIFDNSPLARVRD